MTRVPGGGGRPEAAVERGDLRGLESKVASEILVRGDQAARWALRGMAPGAVATPRTADEAADLLGWASELGLRVGVAGGGSHLGRRVNQEPVDLIVTAVAMNGMHHYEPADLTFTAGAGIKGGSIADVTGVNGQMLPLDPPGWAASTIGGLFSRGHAGGFQTAYGRVRDLALGLTLVTGDGKVLKAGGRVVKNVAGFDLVRLAVGSRGSIGLIVEVSARLFPIPERDAGLWIGLQTEEQLLECGRVVREAPFPLSGAEARDRWLFQGGRRGMVLRVHGNTEPAEEMCRYLLGALEEHSPQLLADEAFGAAMKEMGERNPRISQSETGTSLRLSGLPADLGITLGLARELEGKLVMGLVGVEAGADADGLGAGRGPSDIRCAPLTGEVRVEIFGPPAIGVEAAVEAVTSARTRLELRGGSLEILSGPTDLVTSVGPGAAARAVGALESGLRRVFDPGGTLVRRAHDDTDDRPAGSGP